MLPTPWWWVWELSEYEHVCKLVLSKCALINTIFNAPSVHLSILYSMLQVCTYQYYIQCSKCVLINTIFNAPSVYLSILYSMLQVCTYQRYIQCSKCALIKIYIPSSTWDKNSHQKTRSLKVANMENLLHIFDNNNNLLSHILTFYTTAWLVRYKSMTPSPYRLLSNMLCWLEHLSDKQTRASIQHI